MKQLLKRYLTNPRQKNLPLTSANTRGKYKKSGLTNAQASAIKQDIEQAFETDKIYRNSDIGLGDLALHIAHDRYKVSEVINTYYAKNFYALLNSYRIGEAKHLLVSDPSRSVKAIMYEVGFNSKNSFYLAFKKSTGMSPNDFRSSDTLTYRPPMAS